MMIIEGVYRELPDSANIQDVYAHWLICRHIKEESSAGLIWVCEAESSRPTMSLSLRTGSFKLYTVLFNSNIF